MTGLIRAVQRPLRYFALDDTGHASHKEQAGMVPARSDEPHEVAVQIDMDNFPAV